MATVRDRDLEDVPEEVRNSMTFHLAGTITDVLQSALRDDIRTSTEYRAVA